MGTAIYCPGLLCTNVREMEMPTYTYRRITKNDLHLIKPLWEQLNEIHRRDSVYFKEFYEAFTFEARAKKFRETGDEFLFVHVVQCENRLAGYCAATVSGTMGEIDSIFVEEGHREKGIGGKLLTEALVWMKEHGVSRKFVTVVYGHETAFPFYQKYGFAPRLTFLEMKD
ncbi:MAG TPA: GNAT family N-acetyltransferase [Spirochaetota bacterium]|nr:GNAT family N-acetyltransferase [Spirochaetota bacterium]